MSRPEPEMRFLSIGRDVNMRRAGEQPGTGEFTLRLTRGARGTIWSVPLAEADLAKIVRDAGEALVILARKDEA